VWCAGCSPRRASPTSTSSNWTAGILRAVGPEFEGNDRVSLIHGDALECELGGEWDFAWHDIWCEGSGLQLLHLKLMDRFGPRCKWQGAWMLPRFIKRTLRRGRCAWRLIG
jgi:hypothetical protein